MSVLYFTSISPLFSNSSGGVSFDVHAAHRQLAQEAQQNTVAPNTSNIPGLDGDKTKRYTASFNHPQTVLPNQDTPLHFQIFEASSGNPVSIFRIAYAKPMHLIITDSTLSYFSHMHPTQQGNDFTITTQFPKTGLYHIYINFQPLGGIEQQMAFTLPVGVEENDTVNLSTQPVDKAVTKVFGDYAVTMNTHGTLRAEDMSLGVSKISFTLTDAKTKQPITTLKPYLNSFGHLTMIEENTYDFLHIHPYNVTIPAPDATSGPTVDFLPIGIYGAFKPGIYRAFAEFNPDGKLFTADFTVKVE
jgi:hypothetical protein